MPCDGPAPKAGVFKQWVRFSFGPPEPNLLAGLARLRTLVDDARAGRVSV